jgi:hypothetical protein
MCMPDPWQLSTYYNTEQCTVYTKMSRARILKHFEITVGLKGVCKASK